MSPSVTTYTMPAEWEPHAATWLAWPANPGDWPGRFPQIPWAYVAMARHVTPGERLHIVVQSGAQEARAHDLLVRACVDVSQVSWFRMRTNRGWARDSGPIFARDGRGRQVILGFQFTAWAKYADWQRDATVPRRVARRLRVPLIPVRHREGPVVLEGGAIDVNGAGTVITTEECLLADSEQVRNPGYDRRDYESVFAKYLGAPQAIWLGKGIYGDDTHGHVDDVCRFVNRNTLVLAQEEHPSDVNYRPLRENFERLQTARLEDGSRPQVVTLPMPDPVVFEGQRLPASYANFYIANRAVIVPTFNDPSDRIALGRLQELFPDRMVVGIHALDLVWGLGTLHCLTQQQPA